MRAPHITTFDTRSAVRRLLAGGMSEPEADAVVDVIGGLATKEDIRPLATREELYRALVIQTGVFAGIVAAIAAIVAVIVAILLRL